MYLLPNKAYVVSYFSVPSIVSAFLRLSSRFFGIRGDFSEIFWIDMGHDDDIISYARRSVSLSPQTPNFKSVLTKTHIYSIFIRKERVMW